MKERKTFYLDENEIDYIMDYKKQHGKSSRNEALSCILAEHKLKSEIPMQSMYEFISKQVAKELKNELKDAITSKVTDTLKPQLNSLKFATNATNKDTQILLELINGIYYKENYGGIPMTDKHSTIAYEMSKKFIDDKIENKHYRNSNTVD